MASSRPGSRSQRPGRAGSSGGAGGSARPEGNRARPAHGAPRLDAAKAAATLRELLEAPLVAAGFDLESLSVSRAGARHVVAVAVDRDGGLDLDAVAEASRLASAVLDERDDDLPAALRDAYVLEVSSRGATAPLELPRHWRRARGRLVRVRRSGGLGEVTGRITAADDDGADLETDAGLVRVAYADVAKAVVQLEFRRVGDPDPAAADDDTADDTDDADDADDADDIEDEEETP